MLALAARKSFGGIRDWEWDWWVGGRVEKAVSYWRSQKSPAPPSFTQTSAARSPQLAASQTKISGSTSRPIISAQSERWPRLRPAPVKNAFVRCSRRTLSPP
eukprot:5466748-Prymnesium_polylepis.1